LTTLVFPLGVGEVTNELVEISIIGGWQKRRGQPGPMSVGHWITLFGAETPESTTTEITLVTPDPHHGEDSFPQSRRLSASPVSPVAPWASGQHAHSCKLVSRGVGLGHRWQPH
jgi:hypothetical protein